MELLERAKDVLEEGGFVIHPIPETGDQFAFEDENVFGFLVVTAEAREIVSTWEARQDSFIRQTAVKVYRLPEKAWNAYAVFLTAELCPAELVPQFLAIEEDFRGARKIARTGVEDYEDIRLALAPLLRLRQVAALEPVDLLDRIRNDPAIPAPLRTVLGEGATGEQIARALLEAR